MKDPQVTRDVAELLYRHGVGGIGVSLISSSFLACVVHSRTTHAHVATWWLAMAGALLVRALDARFSSGRRTGSSWNGDTEIRRFGCGVFLTALLWIAFPLAFFSSLDLVSRSATAIILSALAGGSGTVLAPSLALSIGYCASMLLPASFMFLRSGGVENHVLGILGCIFFAVMLLSARVSHASTLAAIRLNHANQRLLVEVEGQRNLAQQTNAELQQAQAALCDANLSLESRIQARTADLEHEIAERKRYAEELSRLASTDPLTGLCNRAKLSSRLHDILAAAQQAGEAVALLFVDLDKFKEVNDVKGHLTGDRVLQAVAQRLSRSTGAGTDLARWGGDEFVVVRKLGGNSGEAIALAESVRASLVEPISLELDTVLIDATIGIAIFPEHGRLPDDLIRAADVAMYAGKEEKRGGVRLYDPALAAALIERHQLEESLRRAIATNAFRVLFQPIVNARDERCEALEALLRWNDPSYGAVSPDKFIPLAERAGEIVSIGRWVLGEACRTAAAWPGKQPPAVSVNVSVAQLLSGDFPFVVLDSLTKSGLPPHRLHLELTESVFGGAHESIASTLRRIRELGVRISLDDFGTGLSSLADLHNLPIDIIKIDKSFISALEKESPAIIGAILSIARALRLEIIAEGVENRWQAEILRAMGVDYFQGYLYAKPMTAAQAMHYLSERQEVLAPLSNSANEAAPLRWQLPTGD
ncbi:MAG: EAL domain-containing protein [Candidatus Korobacteraceae bacterium]